MNATLLKALVALAPTLMLFSGSVFLYVRTKTMSSLIQVVGAGCLMVVVLTHVCEGLNLFPSMRWGAEDSIGHYLDLSSAVLGLSRFPIGYLFYALAKRHS
jgi:succinate dehydrogenase/fumarate reductase cytochrome b subunit